ncbi:rho GTPase-activating protein 12b isoform X8 [Latimeria chalumnae]|uniref:rho GTPase-activating protein 12b isoform X8 n=1 Tax=Latimeria chalumnae TaxID=7897 RepID=UPI0003C14587|nr:PREDICTED: rho GTPase-activating protein 12 isoform X8 [Latimeria chalumnae]|eukprot:XP_005994734.1 PREDICTED: rho GTPase-activating protein 12 isoform X8 [Latimeria chalumnae]
MADRDGKFDLPIIPGQVYIEVEYDYEYEAKENKIIIRQGERYILLKKTNEDWWHVRKDENSKPFYVPAQYVKELPRKALMPPVKQAGLHASGSSKQKSSLQKSTENESKVPELSSFGKPSPAQTAGHARETNQNLSQNNNPSQSGQGLDSIQNNVKSHSPKTSSKNRITTGGRFPCSEFMEVEKTSFSQEQSCDSAGEGSEKHLHDSESGDDLSSSSTEHMQPTTPTGQGRSDSPIYANLQELKLSLSSLPPAPASPPIQTNGEWETHKDANGRYYYYNRATQETTWKPPRSTRDTSGSKGDSQSQGDQEWMKHVDERGRPYYYSADGSRSEWELPKYNVSPPQPGEIAKSKSLDRKHIEPLVLTKWRHSTYTLDTSDKESPTGPKQNFPENESSPTSPKHSTTVPEKCGILNVTKITEHGKKVRKNWTSSWTVLQGSSLLFAKSQGSGTGWKFGSNQSKPEFTVDLKGASLEWASKDKSSKKHVIELKTRQGTELLIQSENDSVINEWYKALSETISSQAVESDEAIEEDMPESPGVEKHDKEREHRDSKKSRMKTSVSVESSEQKKTKTKLKKFLNRRPTLQAVREKGYIKDQVFGSSLTSLCQRENTTVPKFVKMCIEYVEKHGLDIDGLYRVSGNLAIIQKLRFAVNHDEKLDLNDSKWEDIHVVTGALKMFFRELPEPLFTYNYFNDFVQAIKTQDKHRVHAIRDLIKQLPKPNQDTMQALFKHLKKIIDNGEVNRMTTQSVAIVFGPTLLRPEKETGNIAVHMVYQNQIVELILLEYDSIFGH